MGTVTVLARAMTFARPAIRRRNNCVVTTFLVVIGDCTPDMRVVREEVFGPVVVAYKFSDEADAVSKANDSEFGLAASVWSTDVKRCHRVADKLEVGIVWLNDHHRNDPSSPWGGMKDSGVGRENGLEVRVHVRVSSGGRTRRKSR